MSARRSVSRVATGIDVVALVVLIVVAIAGLVMAANGHAVVAGAVLVAVAGVGLAVKGNLIRMKLRAAQRAKDV